MNDGALRDAGVAWGVDTVPALLAHRLGSRSSAIRHTRTPDPGAHLSDDSMHTQPAELGTERESVMEDWRISTALGTAL